MKRVYKIIQTVFLITLSILLSLALLEILVRAINVKPNNSTGWDFIEYASPLNFYSLDTSRIYKINPSKIIGYLDYASDEFGFRYNPDHPKNNIGRLTIIAVGDSFTFGHPVSSTESYPFHLEKLLKKVYPSVIVHNAGVPGYGLDQEYLYLRDEIIPKYRPNLIIWNLNHNDLGDSNYTCLFRKKNDNQYEQISGVWNTLYFKYYYLFQAIKRLPKWLQRAKLIAVLMSQIPERYTIGCTANNWYNRNDFEDKATYFFQNINNQITSYGGNLILNIVLDQQAFEQSPEFPDWASQQKYLHDDTHAFISAANHSNTTIVNSNTLYLDLPSQKDNVLGVSTETGTSDLFMANESFDIGWRHLNEKGYSLMAKLVGLKIMEYLPLPSF